LLTVRRGGQSEAEENGDRLARSGLAGRRQRHRRAA
jgi:hypothetical protein